MMKQHLDVKVRPLSNTSLEKASLLGAARVYLSKDSFISLTGNLDHGKLCVVEKLDDQAEPLKREAILWTLPEKHLSPNVVLLTRAFQKATGLNLGDQVRISLAGTVPDASEVCLETLSKEHNELEKYKPTPDGVWECIAGTYLNHAQHVFPGMIFEGAQLGLIRWSFKVISVDSQGTNIARFTPSTTVRLLKPDEEDASSKQPTGKLEVTGIPGFASEIHILNRFLEGFTRPFRGKGERLSCAFVIHGGHGTGKTFILEQIAATNWGRVHHIKHTDKLASIRETFKLANTQRPSMVFIDGLEHLITKDRANRELVIEILSEELDSLSKEAISNHALPPIIVMATCLDYLNDIPPELQKLSRFYLNTALPIPAAPDRLEILTFIDPPIRVEEKEEVLKHVAQETHAYNPNDLHILVSNAWKEVRREHPAEIVDGEDEEQYYLTGDNFDKALRATRASAMHDINLRPPTVHWDDIAGQQKLKSILTRMIKNIKNENPEMRRVVPNPPKGILLYGPPGCSKTLCAQAMATESGFNFFSVKGAELLNMYVGESERAVRNLFERARRALPSLIFFDEIDSIGGQRPGAAASRSTSSVNTVTTLLTEMDGFETLHGVLVVAATNRPEAMDPALMRPGRFDHVVYVGPPDLPAREAVFNVRLRDLSISSDINTPELAQQTEGYSAAEIGAICTRAGVAAQERYEEHEGTEQVLEINMEDLTEAIQMTPRNITKSMIESYEKWAKQFKKI
ncbi:Fc.00g091270.m01.CDS01 [Cosmosporella sp. VM-42]